MPNNRFTHSLTASHRQAEQDWGGVALECWVLAGAGAMLILFGVYTLGKKSKL